MSTYKIDLTPVNGNNEMNDFTMLFDHNPAESSHQSSATGKILRILLPVKLDKAYDYSLPAHLDAEEGSYVEVSFGPQRLIGVVWQVHYELPKDIKLKPVGAVLPVPAMTQVMRDFVEWVGRYTMTPMGLILKMCLSGSDLRAKAVPHKLCELLPRALEPGLKLTETRKKVIEILQRQKIMSLADLAEKAGCGASTIQKMAEIGILKIDLLFPWQMRKPYGAMSSNATLSPEQQKAAEVLVQHCRAEKYTCTVIDGVTGSGKTEVYFEAIAECLNAGRQVLVMLPEIALSDGWFRRFEKRFGVSPDLWHSDLSQKKRRETWMGCVTGKSSLIVGARSSLFLPFRNLGLIIVDEEHESAYKQEEGVLYQGRDMAIVRAHLSQIPIFLASATPSLETWQNVQQERYDLVALRERHGGAQFPEVNLVDLKENKPPSQRWIAPIFIEKMHEVLNRGEQVMLFLNRRGYAPLILCRSCGHRFQCPHCTAWLVEHRAKGVLQCHHCDFSIPFPNHCPKCKAVGELAACGPGVERIAEEVKRLFPTWDVGVITSDTMQHPLKLAEMMQAIYDRRIQILIGTQMLAKGHHFPHLTLVGVIDADAGMMGGDLRAAEKTFQLLQQVAGRAGREDMPGSVYIQTHHPENPILEAMQQDNRDAFVAYELEMRNASMMPPFYRLAAVILSGSDMGQVLSAAEDLARLQPSKNEHVVLLGPAPAPIAILRGKYRVRFLIKAPKAFKMQSFIAEWLSKSKIPSAIKLQIDVDPYHFL
jgi:primosomal protein N' (replication factor Y)